MQATKSIYQETHWIIVTLMLELRYRNTKQNAKVNIGLGPVLDVTAASPSLDFFF